MEDYEIIKKLKSGDDVTFRLVIEKYQKMVLNCSYKFLRNKESAEDITQEVFFESLLNEVQFKRRRIIYSESFQTYEFTVLGESQYHIRYIHSGKPYEGKPLVRFDEGSRETGHNSN